jgi:pimeloyl-ACP methyl ester carboxylesterase
MELDIYNPRNPNKAPYSSEFLELYKIAQIARNRKITAWVKNLLDDFRRAGDLTREHAFIVHRTMADPRWLDKSIDPNDRRENWCFLGEPSVVNNSPIGLGRFCSLRSWLSQWSYDDAKGDGINCAKDISTPVLVIGNSADDGITPSHTKKLYEAVTHNDKELHWIEGANHYYFGQPEKSDMSASICLDWLERKNLLSY